MYCHTFSTGLSSGHLGGSVMMVTLAGTTRRVDMCQPAWSTRRTAWAAGSTAAAISARCRFIASVLQAGRIRAAPLASLRANRTEDVGRGGTLVTRCAWAGAALRPATGNLVLLADTSLVGEPDFYRVAVERLRVRDFFQAQWEAFLKSSIAPCACAWWRGRA